jgi:hypothetical protein
MFPVVQYCNIYTPAQARQKLELSSFLQNLDTLKVNKGTAPMNLRRK